MGIEESSIRGSAAISALAAAVICSAAAIAGGLVSDRPVAITPGTLTASAESGQPRSSSGPDMATVPGRLTGANSCAASSCHGGGRVAEDLSFAASQVWQRRDPHARAWQVLTQPLALEMMRRLAAPGTEPIPATEDTRCLNCHVSTESPYAEARVSETVNHRDGVSCESCHGAASGWLAEHTTARWRGYSAKRKAELGFIDTTGDLLKRAQICADCHVGGEGKDVNHDLIAAGHPRLDFDFRVFHANEPRHWTAGGPGDRNRALNVELRQAFEAEAWLAGQVAGGRAAARLLQDRTGEGRPWPELAEYSCFSCHHDLRADSWYRLARGSVGRLQWGTWTFGPKAAAFGGLGGGVSELAQLRQLMQRPLPDRGAVREAAQKLDSAFSGIESTFPPKLDRQGLIALSLRLIDEHAVVVAASSGSVADAAVPLAAGTWDEAAQLYLGLHAATAARRKTGDEVTAEEEALLEGLRQGLVFEENVDSPGSPGFADRVREWSLAVAKFRELLQGRAAQ
ncbi:MAG: hypothetical protein RLZZ436_1762 [Planctomycetota bacterium]|jgi:hypothetical protein